MPAEAVNAADDSDEALLAAWADGDPTAFGVVYERWRGRALAYAIRMVGRREVAEEVCVDVFTRVLEGAWQPTGRFRPFLFTALHRACIDRLRRERSWRKAWLRWLPDREAATPDAAVLADDRQRQLERALATLSDDHRAVIGLYYGQELPSREVATILGCTDQQVRSRLSYARRLLREALEAP